MQMAHWMFQSTAQPSTNETVHAYVLHRNIKPNMYNLVYYLI